MRTICVSIPSETTEEQLDKYVQKYLTPEGMYDLVNCMEDAIFKFNGCPKNSMKCCGSCTARCRSRCPQDLIYKLSTYSRTISDTFMRAIIISYISNPNKTYQQGINILEQLCSSRYNKSLKGQENPYVLDYSCRPLYNSNGTLRTDEYGNIQFMSWPDSGLCPYCLPRVTTIRKKGRPSNDSKNY